jgi:hypothetical protein
MKWTTIWTGISLQRRLSSAFWIVLLALSVVAGPRALVFAAGLCLSRGLHATYREVRRLRMERQHQELRRCAHPGRLVTLAFVSRTAGVVDA